MDLFSAQWPGEKCYVFCTAEFAEIINIFLFIIFIIFFVDYSNVFTLIAHRLFQNISLGEWMNAMEHGSIASSNAAFRLYIFSVCVVFCSSMLRSFVKVAANLNSAKVQYCVVGLVEKFLSIHIFISICS